MKGIRLAAICTVTLAAGLLGAPSLAAADIIVVTTPPNPVVPPSPIVGNPLSILVTRTSGPEIVMFISVQISPGPPGAGINPGPPNIEIVRPWSRLPHGVSTARRPG